VADQSSSSDVGARYAQALFDLAVEADLVAQVEADLELLGALRRESADLRMLLTLPAFDAEQKGQVLAALAERAALSDMTRKFVGLLAANRRLGALDAITAAFRRRSAVRRGEVSAQVVTAVAMTDAQASSLERKLRETLGREPRIEARVDPAILGGLKVKVGSRLYDASLKSKLDSLKSALERA
jgi:F-type H+-transporting ATPase subunit delta